MKFLGHTKSIVWLFFLMVGWCLATPTVSAQDWEIVRRTDWETNFMDVDFFNTQNGWAVGWSGVIAHTTDGGTTWLPQTSGTRYHLEAVHFINATMGWAVGWNGTILRTTNGGDTWNPQLSGSGEDLYDVHFVDANNGWVGGDRSTLLRTTDGGKTWTLSPVVAPFPFVILGVHFVDPLKGWAVGFNRRLRLNLPPNGQILTTTDGGVNWEEVDPETFPSNTEFIDVHFVSSSEGWISGFDGILLHTSDGGANWGAENSGTNENLDNIFFQSRANGWLVGSSGTILHTNNGGTTWSTQDARTSNSLGGVNFVSANEGWAVGEAGIIIHTVNGGTSWTSQSDGESYRLQDSYFVTADEGWAVGTAGTILYTTDSGATWERQQTDTRQRISGIDFVSATEGWTVGTNGLILRTMDGGNTWILQISGTGRYLTDVDFVNNKQGWVVGSDRAFNAEIGYFSLPIVLRTTNGGSTWIPLSIDANATIGESLVAISFVNTMRGWVVGSGGTIMRTDNGGAAWTAQNSGVTAELVDVFFLNPDKGWIVGESGTILHTTNGGDTWTPQQSNVVGYLDSIYFKTPNEGWAVGEMGVIVHTIDGGATWTFETSDVENDLVNVSFIDDKGYIVGDWGIVLAMEQEPILLSLPTDFRAKPNETITLPITVNDTTGIGNGNITIAYNTNNVELLQAADATITLLTEDFNVVKDTTTPGELTITFSSATPLSAGSGALFNIVFHVNSNVAVGSSAPLTFKSVSIQNIPDPQTQDGMVTIIGTPGDLNNDDILDVRDAILALRQIKNLSTPNPVYEQSVSDVNGDGQLNEADVDHLLRQDVGLQ